MADGMQLASADKSQVSSGAENPGTFNFTESLPWGAITMALRQANSTTVGSKFTTITLPNLTLMNEAKISNVNINGDVVVDSVVDLNNIVVDGDMDITNAGTYNFYDVEVTGDVTNSDSGGNVQIYGFDGTTLTTSEPGTGNGQVNIQVVSVTTIINLKDNTEVRVYDAGTTDEVAGIESVIDGTPDSRTFSFTYTVGNLVDIIVYNIDYKYYKLSNYTIPAFNTPVEVTQRFDRNYYNP